MRGRMNGVVVDAQFQLEARELRAKRHAASAAEEINYGRSHHGGRLARVATAAAHPEQSRAPTYRVRLSLPLGSLSYLLCDQVHGLQHRDVLPDS